MRAKASDFRSNRSLKSVHMIFPPALRNMSVTRDLATVLAECKTSEKFQTQQDVGLAGIRSLV